MILVSWCPWILRTESVRYSNTMAAAALRELSGFRELLLEIPPKRVFREPKNAKEEKDYLDSCIPKATRYATKWAYKIFGEWQSSRRNKDANFEETGFEVELEIIQSLEKNIVEIPPFRDSPFPVPRSPFINSPFFVLEIAIKALSCNLNGSIPLGLTICVAKVNFLKLTRFEALSLSLSDSRFFFLKKINASLIF